MPSRAPSYYHWSQDKPVTTNQTYGFELRDLATDDGEKKKKLGPFDYTRPFSNSAFFPTISHDNSLTAPARSQPLARLRPCNEFCPPGVANVFDINRGYVMGRVPITEKINNSSVPVGVSLSRSVTAPPAYVQQESRAKDLYLWHTLSGTQVHCKNYPPQSAPASN